MAGRSCTTPGCSGHFLDDGFCDTCGAGANAPKIPVTTPPVETTLTTAGEAGEACPECGTARDVDSSFCEACGHPFVAGKARPATPPTVPGPAVSPAPPAGSTAAAMAEVVEAVASAALPGDPGGAESSAAWEAVVSTDPAWYAMFGKTWEQNEQGPCPITFPGEKERTVVIHGPVVIVGRHADGIDIAEDPDDLAASHKQASLALQADGSWLVTDLGSSNGTYVGDTRLGDGESTSLADGAWFNVGAFTRITIKSQLG